ncbi:hypothetical protein F5Y15DRAFT_423391 [Xylariaceae sp. FL0016]|nr:hypothetical protein F5Y15DRAFT_423391 [Xylariaceae sp. FL0016]
MTTLISQPSNLPSSPSIPDPAPTPIEPLALSTGHAVRLAARANTLTTTTSGLAPSHLQANLLILPSRYAADFRLLCARNPVPCPLLAESATPGSFTTLTSHIPSLPASRLLSSYDLDLRRDCPRYHVYRDGRLVPPPRAGHHRLDIRDEWTPDHVAFLLGCSFSFEAALAAAGLPPRHTRQARVVPMYRTRIPLCPAGVFADATHVVSMRSYPASRLDAVRRITRAYGATHGEPVAWGWGSLARLGIAAIDAPEWGDAPLTEDGRPLGAVCGSEEEVPVFWGCGVTPQEAVMRAGLEGTVMAHAPGHMLVLDCVDEDIMGS